MYKLTKLILVVFAGLMLAQCSSTYKVKNDMSKKILNGKVIRDQNDKTIIVLVKRRYSHPFFGKVITSSKKYHAHDEKNKFKIGDNVKIIESKPFSKKKKWEVINK